MNAISTENLELYGKLERYSELDNADKPTVLLHGRTLAEINNVRSKLFEIGYFVRWLPAKEKFHLIKKTDLKAYFGAYLQLGPKPVFVDKVRYSEDHNFWYLDTQVLNVNRTFLIRKSNLEISENKGEGKRKGAVSSKNSSEGSGNLSLIHI